MGAELVKRLRDLAARRISGEIPQFEYDFAADRIEQLEQALKMAKEEMERAAIACAHTDAQAASGILLAAIKKLENP